eukprot:8165544-Pyramimonas_sp.AAC.1
MFRTVPQRSRATLWKVSCTNPRVETDMPSSPPAPNTTFSDPGGLSAPCSTRCDRGHGELHVPRGDPERAGGRQRPSDQDRAALGHLVPGLHPVPDGVREDPLSPHQGARAEAARHHRPQFQHPLPPAALRQRLPPRGEDPNDQSNK